MKFDLTSDFSFSSDITSLTEQLKQSIDNIWENSLKKYGEHQPIIKEIDIKRNKITIHLVSHGLFRPHSILLQMKNVLSKELGTHYNIGIRDITISKYQIEFDLEKKPLKNFTIPFATLHFHQHTVTIIMNDLGEEFLRKNYIDRMITLIKEKVENQYYTGKEEFWKLIWKSGDKQPLWTKNPTEEMHKQVISILEDSVKFMKEGLS